ncbi:MAG: hypothetical protein WA140_06680 [Geobacteraceae bacterium]
MNELILAYANQYLAQHPLETGGQTTIGTIPELLSPFMTTI